MYRDVQSLPGGIEDTFVPGRNLMFGVLAANRAAHFGAQHIVLGVNAVDYGGYPDCRESAMAAMEWAINECFTGEQEGGIIIDRPLMELDKTGIVELAVQLGRDCLDALAQSHTCYAGECPPCGHCHACLQRADGFDKAGVIDPLVFQVGIRR